MQRVLAGQAQHMHGAAMCQGATCPQHPWRRGCLIRSQKLVAPVLVLQGHNVRERSLGGKVGHGGGWRGLTQSQASTRGAQAWLPRHMQLFAGEAGLALKQRSGCGLQNEFGALNALVLVALESSRSQQKEGRERQGRERVRQGREGVGEEKPLVTCQ